MRSRPQYAEEDWLVLVTTDHGGKGNSHGDTELVPVAFHRRYSSTTFPERMGEVLAVVVGGLAS
jgi:hypothetical protein